MADESTDTGHLQYLRAAGSSPGARAMAAALRARQAAKVKAKEIPVIYGSQTGNAMDIAKSINAEARSKGFPTMVMVGDEYPVSKLANASLAVFVLSSTGDGDPPENFQRMYKKIHETKLPLDLSNLRFTVLGLGDSNYTRFMYVPRTIHKRLCELGAKPFYKLGEADEVTGLEDAVEMWISGLWDALKKASDPALQGPPKQQINGSTNLSFESKELDSKPKLPAIDGVPALQPCRITLIWNEAKPSESKVNDSDSSAVLAKVTDARVMTAEWSDRKVIHLELESDKFLSMKAGDSISVTPTNNEDLVDKFIARLGLTESKDKVFEASSRGSLPHIKQPCSLRNAFLRYCDITSVLQKGFIRVLAESCKDENEKHRMLLLCSRGGKEEYKAVVQDARLGIVDFLNLFPSCHPPVEHILDQLRPLSRRYYSLSNSPSVSKDSAKVQVAFSVVRTKTAIAKGEKTQERVFEGVCTTWLERLVSPYVARVETPELPSITIPVHPKSGGPFRPPSRLDCPLIMIGPGTGVSPFRGFLQERENQIKKRTKVVRVTGTVNTEELSGERSSASVDLAESVSESWLFFGCRKEDEDFLYKEDLQYFHTSNVLDHLVVAFSREKDTKVYVQDKIKEHGEEIASLLLNKLTHVYVCGDGTSMAKDVHAALLHILENHKKLDQGNAISHMNTMIKEERYVRDIWS